MDIQTADASKIDLSDMQQQIHSAFKSQKENKYRVGNTLASERIEKLKKLLTWIQSNKQAIRDAVYADFRKPAPEVDLQEVYVTILEIKHAVRHLKKWMKPKKVSRTLQLINTRAWIRCEPKGVVLIISPWNYPFLLAVGPLISAIAAGNCIIMKPSEISPNTSHLIREMVEELFSANEVAVFEGDKEVATELLKEPFDHIFYTGSSVVGKIVMKAAAENLSTVTLELGGKSPVIVDETADIPDAAKKIVWGKYLNAGQTCVAPDYLLVHDSVSQRFLEAMNSEIKKMYGESDAARRQSSDFARIINFGHFDRLKKMMEESEQEGAGIEIGGEIDGSENYIAPTILTGVGLDSPLMQEEIFGPVLPVIPFKTLIEVIDIINSLDKPLALYIFSKNQKNIDHIMSYTSAGGTCINDVVVQFFHENLPFGGINNSGFGNSHGYYGFKSFSHERAVVKSNRYSFLKLIFPPFTGKVRKLIDFMLKYL